MPYKRPQILTKRQNASANRTDAGVFVNVGLIAESTGGVGQEQLDIIRESSPTLLDFIDANLSDAAVSYKGFTYTKDVDYEVKTATGQVEWKTTKLTPPYIKAATASTLSGTLAANTYYYYVTAINVIIAGTPTPTYGETTVSNEVQATLSAQGQISLSWSKVDLAEGYRIYRSTATGTETMIRELMGQDKTNWDDTGLYTPGVVAFPVANTATKRPPFSVADTAAYWTSGVVAANLVALQGTANGSLTVQVDALSAIEVTAIDFTGDLSLADCAASIQTALQPQLGTKGYFQSADASMNLTNLVQISDGRINVNIDAAGAVDTANIDFTGVTDMDQAAILIQSAVQTATVTSATCAWDATTGLFKIFSDTRGVASSVAIAAPAAGTNLTTASYLNFLNGAAAAGTNSAITCVYDGVGTTFVVTSPTLGSTSTLTITEGVAGTPIGGALLAAMTAAAGGAETAGTDGTKISYVVDASISGSNFFDAEQFFSIADIAVSHGSTSTMYTLSEKMLVAPPTGQGCSLLTCVGVPSTSRGAFQAALEEIGKVDIDVLVLASTNVDVMRDLAAHCIFWSRDENKKERIPILGLDPAQGMDAFISLAGEFSADGDRVGIIFDNYTQETYIAPIVMAAQAALSDRAKSLIGTKVNITSTLLNSGRVADTAITYLLSNGVMTLSKDDSGVLTIIDDVMVDGNDITGRLVEDYMRKTIRLKLNSLKGKSKVLGRTLTAIEEITATMLDSFTYNELINSYNRQSVVAARSPVNPQGAILRFTYTRQQTLKVIEVFYAVLDQ